MSWVCPGACQPQSVFSDGRLEHTVNPVNHSARIQQMFPGHLSWAGPFTSVRPTSPEEAPRLLWLGRGGAAVFPVRTGSWSFSEGLTRLSPGELLQMLTCGPNGADPGVDCGPGCVYRPGFYRAPGPGWGRRRGRVGLQAPLHLQLSIPGPHSCYPGGLGIAAIWTPRGAHRVQGGDRCSRTLRSPRDRAGHP